MTARLHACTPAEVQRALRKLGFELDRQRGSHRVFVRAADDCTIVLPWHTGDLKRGTLHAIVRALGLTIDQFLALR
jgi:predicted RNA binding protein YcfA (HicA-like mRNA interferase family)